MRSLSSLPGGRTSDVERPVESVGVTIDIGAIKDRAKRIRTNAKDRKTIILPRHDADAMERPETLQPY